MKYLFFVMIIFLFGCRRIGEYNYNVCDFSNSNDSLFKVVLPDTSLESPDKFTIEIINELKFNDLTPKKASNFYGVCKAKRYNKSKVFNLLLFTKKTTGRKPLESYQPYDFLFFEAYKKIECSEFTSSFNVDHWIDPNYPVLIGQLSFVIECANP